MKKLVYLAVVFALMTSFAYADKMVPASSLPANAQSFLKTAFPGVETMYVEADWDDFEVRMANGAKIEFHKNGEWKKISNYAGVPESAIPASVMQTVKKAYPQAKVVKVEKEWGSWELKLDNRMKMYIDAKGTIVGQKMDD